jgi:hypothetical protein
MLEFVQSRPGSGGAKCHPPSFGSSLVRPVNIRLLSLIFPSLTLSTQHYHPHARSAVTLDILNRRKRAKRRKQKRKLKRQQNRYRRREEE